MSFHGDTINKIGAGLEKMFASAMTLNVLKMYMCKVVVLLQGALRDFSSSHSNLIEIPLTLTPLLCFDAPTSKHKRGVRVRGVSD